MHVVANTLDDLLVKVYQKLARRKDVLSPSKGQTVEDFGNLLVLKNPLARLSRTETKGHVFSCLGEFLWYMSGSDSLEFIQYYIKDYDKYSDDGKTIFGAYGPRLFGMRGNDQISFILNKLKDNPASRKAVIQLFDANDVNCEHKDVPCTCTLQFAVRSKRLILHVNMRSNDAFKGLPHDIFAFTMIQEIIARTLDLGVGHYYHSVGSLHLYTEDLDKVDQFLLEGLQDDVPMPPMPPGDPWHWLKLLIQAEEIIRASNPIPTDTIKDTPPYWQDLIRLLMIFSSKNSREVVQLKNEMSSSVYETFIRKRQIRREERSLLPLLDKIFAGTKQ